MYSVILNLDQESEIFIKDKWTKLKESGITSRSILDIHGARPHITLADYDELDMKNYIERFQAFFSKRKKISINYDVIGTFPTTGTLFAAPTVTKELINFHEEYYKEFEDLNVYANSYYLPGKWIPHTTLAINYSKDELLSSFKFIVDEFKPIIGKVVEAELIRVIYNNDVCIAWEKIYSVELEDA